MATESTKQSTKTETLIDDPVVAQLRSRRKTLTEKISEYEKKPNDLPDFDATASLKRAREHIKEIDAELKRLAK